MPDPSPQEILEQPERRRQLEEAGDGAWIMLYESWRTEDTDGSRFAYFSPKKKREKVLGDMAWDASIRFGGPGFMQSYANGKRSRTRYLRFGMDDGIEPIVIKQYFDRDDYTMLPQLAEEFRMYHNLWISSDGTELKKLKDDGTDEVVAEITATAVRVRTRYVRQFQAARQLDLVVCIDSRQRLPAGIRGDEVQLGELVDPAEQGNLTLSIFAADGKGLMLDDRVSSRLLGKKVMLAPRRTAAGVWPYDNHQEPYDNHQEEYPEFVVGEDDDGRAVRFSCNPDEPANYFGANPDAPHFLTPVFFRREVMQRYYERPELYEIYDGYLRCGHLWSLQLDNDHPQQIAVFLGDIGGIPESERRYWQSFNIAPSEAMSDTAVRRAFLNQFISAGSPEFSFKREYAQLRSAWRSTQGWSILRDLHRDDQHVLARLRIPLNDSQSEFEAQILCLAKLLVDSIDDKSVDPIHRSCSPVRSILASKAARVTGMTASLVSDLVAV